MKTLLLLTFLLVCAGCDQSGPVVADSGVSEFVVEVLLSTDAAGELSLDEEGLYSAECRLKNRVVRGGQVTTPILEAISDKVDRARTEHCVFDFRLPYEFCAMTSIQNDMACEVTTSRDPGWFVTANYRNPQTNQLLCRIACFNHLERE